MSDSPDQGRRPATTATKSAPVVPLGPDFVTRRVLVPASDVVFVKGIVEAHDGLAQVYAEAGGELWISAIRDRAAELDALVSGLVGDGLCIDAAAPPGPAPGPPPDNA